MRLVSEGFIERRERLRRLMVDAKVDPTVFEDALGQTAAQETQLQRDVAQVAQLLPKVTRSPDEREHLVRQIKQLRAAAV